MKKQYFKYFLLALCLGIFVNTVDAQKKKTTTRKSTKRASTKKTTASKTKAKIQPTVPVVDTVAVVAAPPPPKFNDSLPVPTVKKSLRPDEAVETTMLKDRTPLPYENLRADDAMYRHKIWREIDTREKINLPFKYAADENNGNQRFISILFKAIQDSLVTVFDPIDDRFTTPMTKVDIVKKMAGEPVVYPVYDSLGNISGYKEESRDIVLDSFYKFRIKEEVIFDKESSRLFWRILGIAPVMNVYTAQTNQFVGTQELFWVYYPDMRPIFSKYDVYNGKNYGARMSWEDLFESRMFYGRIIKSTIDNPYDRFIDQYPGLKEKGILQLLEGENIKEKIFNYEQDLWSY
ncbi:MAG TPA: gliding motility protein GldN [Ferruginibacter sp.]|nr:gliding motility protein GldN [Chitinophagaceae bacterium]MBK7557378.1 gliding motility protein GldN [Chitinophagaceae bacterium]MBK9532794.1 gliding motility protein GldN [Chitinophagaceae bacterium]HQW91465.1 gliding motility protein GldN [Ferruginibacter sp.]